MNRRRTRFAAIALMIIAVLFIFFYAEHFLYEESPDADEMTGDQPEDSTQAGEEPDPPVIYTHLSTEVNGHIQEIDILEFDPKDKRVKLKPVLSFDRIFGYEPLSKMAARHNAYAAVNGGFFYEYGYPSGMVMIDGKLITAPTGRYPTLIVSSGTAALEQINVELWLESGGKKIGIDGINSEGEQGSLIVYTSDYGLDSRTKLENITAVIQDGIVKDIARFSGAVEIPEDGMLAVKYGQASHNGAFSFSVGDKVEFKYSPFLGSDAQAYECGSWILRDGELVVEDKDAWVGVLTNRDPRTAAGIKEDGTVVLMTVDGRQPDYSIGMTGRELGEFMLSLGIKDAAMLDGGASSEMIVGGEVVNRPSFKGQERPLAGGIVLQVIDKNQNVW